MGIDYFVFAALATVLAVLIVYVAWKEFGPRDEEVPAVQCWWCAKIIPYDESVLRNGLRCCKECGKPERKKNVL